MDVKDYKMHQEMLESPRVVADLKNRFLKDGEFHFDKKLIKALQKADHIIFLACGTSYHASFLGVNMFREMGKMSDNYIASEWAYNPVKYGKKRIYILVSQSGETADILACKKLLDGPIVSITNVRDSSIDKLADFVLPLDCGEEKAIAATKSYVGQALMIALLARAVGKACPKCTAKHVDGLKEAIETILKDEDKIEKLADKIHKASDAFFLGRGVDYYAAIEGTLKLKETCYIHSEAYPGGEIKHGPVALVTDGVPVIGLLSDKITNELFRKNLLDIEKKGCVLLTISSEDVSNKDDSYIVKNTALYLSPIAKVVVLQLLAFYTSLKRGLNIDSPRGLVKAITNE